MLFMNYLAVVLHEELSCTSLEPHVLDNSFSMLSDSLDRSSSVVCYSSDASVTPERNTGVQRAHADWESAKMVYS